MKVFLSWSGPTSRAVARALHDWLPNVLQQVKPWMSAADITPGVRWPLEVGRQLEQSQFGVICLAPGNLTAPWILFEAGALGKQVEGSRVAPYLFRVERSEVTGPLSQFHNVLADREGTHGLVTSIFGALEAPAIDAQRLTRVFEHWWPTLEAELRAIPAEEAKSPEVERSQQDILAELLGIVRGLQRDAARSAAASPPVQFQPLTAERLGEISPQTVEQLNRDLLRRARLIADTLAPRNPLEGKELAARTFDLIRRDMSVPQAALMSDDHLVPYARLALQELRKRYGPTDDQNEDRAEEATTG